MSHSAIEVTTTGNSAQAQPLAREDATFLIARPDPQRWEGTFHEQLGLEPRVLPAPLPKSAEARKVSRLSMIWTSALFRLPDAPADVALKIGQDASAKTFNRLQRRPTVPLAHLAADGFDPGAKLMRGVELASDALFDLAADGTFPNVELIEWVGKDLVAFHAAHHDVNDCRFTPVRLMGRFLVTLAGVLRDAE